MGNGKVMQSAQEVPDLDVLMLAILRDDLLRCGKEVARTVPFEVFGQVMGALNRAIVCENLDS